MTELQWQAIFESFNASINSITIGTIPLSLDESTQEFLSRVAAAGMPPIPTLDALSARQMNDPLSEACEHLPCELASVEDFEINTDGGTVLNARCYRSEVNSSPSPVLVFYHGGGGVMGNLETHDSMCRTLAHESGCAVIAVEYRLGPEHPFPTGPHDARSALEWVFQNASELGVDPTRIAVGGDSAGGALAAVVAQLARDSGRHQLCFQLLIYPAVDANREQAAYPSWKDNGQGYFLDQELCRWFLENYVPPGQDLNDPLLSPLRSADFSGLAPALVVTAGFDPLRDEGAAYAQKLQNAGVVTEYRCYENTIHGFISMGRFIPLAVEALQFCGRRLRDAMVRECTQ